MYEFIHPMIINDVSFNAPQENIAYDDVLLHAAEQSQGGEILRFWESRETFVVLGKTSKLQDDVHLDRTHQDHVPLLRRSSGGGTVLQGKGCLNFTLVLQKDLHPHLNDIRKSYIYILEKTAKALIQCGVESEIFPVSDLAMKENNKKFSGNAQKRGKSFILHHGTILYNFDCRLIEQYLKFPKDTPDYREGRSHLDFITNINVAVDPFQSALSDEFQAQERISVLTEAEKISLNNFLSEKEYVLDAAVH